MTSRTALVFAGGGLILAQTVFGCGGDASVNNTGGAATGGTGAAATGGSGLATGGAGAGGGSGASGNTGGVPPPPTEIAMCQDHVYQCGDLIDNDGDGLIDYQDPDCLGPCDNTEDSLFGGIPGQAGPPCLVDCYFDQDSGQGNDQCYWAHWCDPNEVPPNYYPEPENGALCAYEENKPVPVSNGPPQSCQDLFTAQSQNCYDYCGPLTPNGCDCFGCCDIPGGSGNFVFLGSVGASGTSVCTHDNINDPTVCHPCLPVAACFNDCGPCELCIGKTTLPPECFGEGGSGGGGGAPGQCPDGVQVCGLPGQDPCPAGYSCITGCCYEVPK